MMKQLFCLLLLVILISCESSTQIKQIEILTYYTNARNFKIYSCTDKNGFTQTLFKSETSEFVDNYQSRIAKALMDSIINICKNKTDADFKFKSSKRIWYCGDWRSVRITYENGKKIMFQYPYTNNENKQFIAFQSLSSQIQNDSLLATRLNLGQLGSLYLKQEDLSNLTFKKDSMANQKHVEKTNHSKP